MKYAPHVASLALISSFLATPMHAAQRKSPNILEAQSVNDLIDTIDVHDFIDDAVFKRLDENSKEAILQVSAILNGILNAIAYKDNQQQPEKFAESVHSAVTGVTNIILIGAQQAKKSKEKPKEVIVFTRKLERILRSLIREIVQKKSLPLKK